jgi:hypothetical protein
MEELRIEEQPGEEVPAEEERIEELPAEDAVAGSDEKYRFDLPGKSVVQRAPHCFKREDDVRRPSPAASVTLFDAAPELVAQWHPTKNGDVTPAGIASKSHKKYWWRCDAGPDHEWEASPKMRVGNGTGCSCCSGRKVSVTNSLAAIAPEVAAQWHPTKNDLTPADITSKTGTKYWWRCEADPDHEWQASPHMRVDNGRGCPRCRGRKVSVTNSP